MKWGVSNCATRKNGDERRTGTAEGRNKLELANGKDGRAIQRSLDKS